MNLTLEMEKKKLGIVREEETEKGEIRVYFKDGLILVFEDWEDYINFLAS